MVSGRLVLRAALIGALTGGVVGVCELLIIAVRRFGLGHILYLGPQALWMTPAVDLVLFGVIGLLSAIAALVLRPERRTLVVSIVLLAVAFLALLLHVVWLDERAALIVALGVAIQAGRPMSRGWDRISRFAAVSVATLATVVVLLALGLGPALRWQEARRIARLPSAPEGAPNILLLVLDTVRALNLGVYGYNRPTSPGIDSVARQGVVFERAYATASYTLPSHGSFFTGRDAHELNADITVPLDTTFPTLAGRLGAAGYATGAFVANQRYVTPEWGLARGFARFEVYPVTLQELPLNASLTRRLLTSGKFRRLIGYHDIVNRKRAGRVHDELLAWLNRRQDRPFFAFLNYFDAHEPYLPPAPFATMFGATPPAPAPRSDYQARAVVLTGRIMRALNAEEKRRHQDAYDGAIRYLDHEIQDLLGNLTRRGLLENTIVVITSDHGEHQGDGDRYLHSFDLFGPVLHVPLIVVYPKAVPAGVRFADPVSLADLPATLGHLAGIDERLGLPGRSLINREGASGQPQQGRTVMASFRTGCKGEPRFSVIQGRHQYLRDGACGEYLYDLVADPLALNNLLGAAPADSVAAALRALGTARLEQATH